MSQLPTVLIAACHVSPVFLNSEKTTEKALGLIDEAASKGANLIIFPESFIPGFPLFAAASAPVDNEGHFSKFVTQSIYADGPEIAALQTKAAEKHVVISMGFSERSRKSVGCIWNSNVVIAEDGQVVVHHRKICPTYWEKLVWSNGDGEGLRVVETANSGRVGALICGENTNPLARFAMMAQQEHIHVMSFPPAWPTKRKGGYQNRTANAVRGAAHSFEGKCFTVVSSAFLDEEAKKLTANGDEGIMEVLSNATQATTQFFGPDGVQVGDELTEWEGIAYAEVDLNKCIETKQIHDVVGGYNRFDIFDLRITRRRDEPVQWQ
jgi:nitrilase